MFMVTESLSGIMGMYLIISLDDSFSTLLKHFDDPF